MGFPLYRQKDNANRFCMSVIPPRNHLRYGLPFLVHIPRTCNQNLQDFRVECHNPSLYYLKILIENMQSNQRL